MCVYRKASLSTNCLSWVSHQSKAFMGLCEDHAKLKTAKGTVTYR